MDTMRRVVMVACAALLFASVILKSRTGQVSPARAAFRALSSGRVSVRVSGNVSRPGIYVVPANYLALDVIKMADPLCPLKRRKTDSAADLPLHNGSAVRFDLLTDGSHQLTVSRMTVPELLVLGIPLDISTMSEADFDSLPGIGPALARRIVEYRQNNGEILEVEALAGIEGIGEKKYRRILSYFQPPLNKE